MVFADGGFRRGYFDERSDVDNLGLVLVFGGVEL